MEGYADLARACGVDPQAAMRRVRLTPQQLSDADNLIPYGAFIQLLELSAQESGYRDFGLRLAQAQGIGVLGQLSMLLLHASTLGEALQLASRYIFVHSPAVKLQVVAVPPNADLVDITFALDIPHSPPLAQVLELSLGLIIQGILAVTQGAVRPQGTRLPHPQLGPLASYDATMQCACEFNAPVAAVRIATAALLQPLPAHNAQLQAFASQYLDRHFGDPLQRFGDLIRNMLRRFLSSGMGNQADIAKILSLHPRTVQRRLAAEGLQFERLLDDIRQEQFLALVGDADPLPLAQIAFMLGYSEQSVLNRSCRRWYGCTPVALRAAGARNSP